MVTIYAIINLVNERVYVGQTSKSIYNRLNHHFANIKYSNNQMYKDMEIYGKSVFEIYPLEYVYDDEADEREFYWISVLSIDYCLYNMKYSAGKCGGDTITNHPNISEISKKISDKCRKGDNPHASKIKAININTGDVRVYDSIIQCQDDLNIPYHSTISKRCRGVIQKPYNNYKFEYI